MSSAIRNAALAIAVAFAIVLPARAHEPAAVAQTEIRGLDALFSAADRIAAPYVPAGQAKGMFIGACSARAVNPFEVVDGAGTVRCVVYGVDDDWDVLFDLPAAGGDAAGVLGKLAEALPAADVPDGIVLPEGALSVRNGGFSLSGTLCIPRGERIALVPHSAFAHDVRDVDGALALLDAAPDVPAEGVLAAAVDFEAMRLLLANSKAGTTGARMRDLLANPAFPLRSLALGLGLDDADRFRTDFSVAYSPDVPQTRIVSGIGAPVSPLANAILFPDAVAAYTYHQQMSAFSDGELRSFLSGENSIASIVGDDDPQTAAVRDALTTAYIPLIRLFGDEYAAALLPADEGDGSASAALLAFPADPQAALDGLPDCLNGVIDAFSDAIRSSIEADDDDDDDDIPDVVDAASRLRIEPAGGRTVQETSVRRYVLRMDDAEDGTVRDFATFDAAAVGPALYLGTLPDGRLGDVLADLAAGHTAKGPVAAMPSFAAAYGEAPAGAACGYVRLRPLLRALLPALRNLMQTLGADDIELKDLVNPVSFALSLDGHPYLPDITLASTQRWLSEGARLESIVSMPLADLHAAIDAIVACQRRANEIITAHPDRPGPTGAGEDDEEDSEDAPFAD